MRVDHSPTLDHLCQVELIRSSVQLHYTFEAQIYEAGIKGAAVEEIIVRYIVMFSQLFSSTESSLPF